MRYFFAAYAYSASGNKSGFGNLYFKSEKYPSNTWIEEIAKKTFGPYTSMAIINIFEFNNEQDYNDFRNND